MHIKFIESYSGSIINSLGYDKSESLINVIVEAYNSDQEASKGYTVAPIKLLNIVTESHTQGYSPWPEINFVSHRVVWLNPKKPTSFVNMRGKRNGLLTWWQVNLLGRDVDLRHLRLFIMIGGRHPVCGRYAFLLYRLRSNAHLIKKI